MSYHEVREEFEIGGRMYRAIETNSHNSCYYCAFGHPQTNHEAEVCAERKCEPRNRTDGLSVRFEEVEGLY